MEVTKTGEGLKRVVGLPAFSMSIVNNSIGSGMFVLPAIVGIQLGAFGIFCYLFCGIMLAAIMLCYAEVGSRITSCITNEQHIPCREKGKIAEKEIFSIT